jgi:hypothetical protein
MLHCPALATLLLVDAFPQYRTGLTYTLAAVSFIEFTLALYTVISEFCKHLGMAHWWSVVPDSVSRAAATSKSSLMATAVNKASENSITAQESRQSSSQGDTQ